MADRKDWTSEEIQRRREEKRRKEMELEHLIRENKRLAVRI